MVFLRLSRSNKLVSYRPREWDVEQTVAVQMAQLPFAEAKLYAAEPMRMYRHILPHQHTLLDQFSCTFHGSTIALIL